MISNNWQDNLAALRASMDAAEPEQEEITDTEVAPRGLSAQKQRLDIILDRKGRAGKSATIITGFTIPDIDISTLASEIRKALGTGGSARGGEILIQGDRRTDVQRFLTAHGLKCRII